MIDIYLLTCLSALESVTNPGRKIYTKRSKHYLKGKRTIRVDVIESGERGTKIYRNGNHKTASVPSL